MSNRTWLLPLCAVLLVVVLFAILLVVLLLVGWVVAAIMAASFLLGVAVIANCERHNHFVCCYVEVPEEQH